jgi:beta-xylosidase
LVNWEIVNYALNNLTPADFYATPQHGKGVWAPAIRTHNGEYYIYWGDPDFGIYMVKTDNPHGKWSEPVLVKAGKGLIDPCPLWDEDGNAYLVNAWAGSRSGMNSILTVWRMSNDGTELEGNPVLAFDGNDGINHTVEGPKFYKRDGYYYILCPAGGVASGWQLALRSRSPFGPYEAKKVMEQGKSDINGPHQGGLVDSPDGSSWFIHFQDKGLYGRILHLNPVKWANGWPIMGNSGEPVKSYAKPVATSEEQLYHQDSDEFDMPTVGLQWQWHANYEPTFGFAGNMGYMRVYGHALSEDFVNFWEVPNLFLQKFPAEQFEATTKVKISAKADHQQSGIIIMGKDYCRLSLEKVGEGFILKQITCADADQGGKETEETIARLNPSAKYEAGLYPNYECNIWFKVKVDKGGICHFLYSVNGKTFTETTHSFQAREGKWIGAKIGYFSAQPHGVDRGWIDIDYIHFEK